MFFSFASFAEITPAIIRVGSFSEKSIEPNIMKINLQIWAKASTSAQAQEMAAKLVTKAKDTAEKFKIKKELIETTYFQVTPEYTYDNKSSM